MVNLLPARFQSTAVRWQGGAACPAAMWQRLGGQVAPAVVAQAALPVHAAMPLSLATGVTLID